MPRDFIARGSYGLGRKQLSAGTVKYLVTDEFGFKAVLVLEDAYTGDIRIFVPSLEPQFLGLWVGLGTVCTDGTESTCLVEPTHRNVA